MSVQEVIQVAQALSVDERKLLMKALIDMSWETSPPKSAPKRSLREFRGVAAHLYDGIDAQAMVNQVRDEWDDVP